MLHTNRNLLNDAIYGLLVVVAGTVILKSKKILENWSKYPCEKEIMSLLSLVNSH
jgi:hypothetical protein